MARQLAYAGSEEAKDDEIDIGALAGEDFPSDTDVPTRRVSELRQVSSGDRTPRPGSPMPPEPPKRSLPWKSKVSKQEIEAFLQQERQKFFSYQLPGDVDTMFALPIPIHRSVETLRKHLYTSIGELQASDEDYNRYLFSKKEEIELNIVEELYRLLLPNLCQYVVALLKVLLAAAPSNKAKNDALNILVDVLTPETDGSDILSNSISLDHSTSSPLEESVRLAIDINRHKEIMVKATSSILLLLMKHLRLNHIYQFEYLCQHIVYGNGIPLLLKFLDQNMTRVLNKLVKGKQSRVMMLMVFKSAPILKRSLKIRLGLFQFFVLKALKMQSRYLGRQWRKSNMDIMSAIYNKVRHRMTDDWAFANEMRKSYDYHSEESELKAAVERFHSRRYSKLHPQLAIEVSDAPMPGDDYLNRVNLREYEPVDNCFHSVLGKEPELGKRFKNNYRKWMEDEVIKRNIDWDRLLMNTKGIALSHDMFGRVIPRLSNQYSSLRSLIVLAERSKVTAAHRIPAVYGVKKTKPFEAMIEEYAKYHWDDTVTEDDPLVVRLRDQLLSGSRAALASAITLVESRHPRKRAQGNLLLHTVLAAERKRYEEKGKESMIFRIGISGSPGVGKSTFIEAMGKELIDGRGMKVAVLTIDPSSAVTGGSLGGVTRGIHEAIILCEGAGYEVVIIETVGVGQSEVSVADMCDMFCLLLSPAHGDELQGVKRGIMELSDLLVITKDDGDLKAKARLTQSEYISALRYMRPRINAWNPKVLRSSVMDPKSIKAVCDCMFEYWKTIMESGDLEERRTNQMTTWMWDHVREELLNVFQKHPKIAPLAPALEEDVRLGKITPGHASETLIRTFLGL
ncbi:LAO/AO transport system ATPase [Necator americanus]|uniref:LAO/AO transport system ATPase n=1 Tax=Necator americanus TaxID=51031 RepID=W2TSW8_NECAM|nr:LAO/AO transport system ATPase [Necator americanus]ETN85180.1 LAO/AO transport system ATPase [Necator americanus]